MLCRPLQNRVDPFQGEPAPWGAYVLWPRTMGPFSKGKGMISHSIRSQSITWTHPQPSHPSLKQMIGTVTYAAWGPVSRLEIHHNARKLSGQYGHNQMSMGGLPNHHALDTH